MAPDLLSTISHEIDERLNELHPLMAEYQRLIEASDALVSGGHSHATPTLVPRAAKAVARKTRSSTGRRGSAVGAIQPAVGAPAETALDERSNGKAVKPVAEARRRSSTSPRSTSTPKAERAARGVARETILAALDHGSHTVSELAVVTAMSAPNINGNLRKLVSEGAVLKIEREGKAAWALPALIG